MRVTFWGTRGSIGAPGAETVIYGGDTSCVAVSGPEPDHLLVLDAGSGIRRLGKDLPAEVSHIDLLLSHLHLDHIVGLGFFEALFRPDLSVTVWAPPSAVPLLDRLGRYLSPPLFPVRLRDVACELVLRDAVEAPQERGAFSISAAPIIHPDTAVGYRIESGGLVLAYLPDHEPALSPSFPNEFEWTSGAAIAAGADLLIHDAQYGDREYLDHVGWGHSSVTDAVSFANLVGARRLALFHHDPAHNDEVVESLARQAEGAADGLPVFAARQGATFLLDDPAHDVAASGRRLENEGDG